MYFSVTGHITLTLGHGVPRPRAPMCLGGHVTLTPVVLEQSLAGQDGFRVPAATCDPLPRGKGGGGLLQLGPLDGGLGAKVPGFHIPRRIYTPRPERICMLQVYILRA